MSGTTEGLRQELARELPRERERAGLLAALVALAGSLHLRDGGLHLEVATTSGAVARLAFALLRDRGPELRVLAPGGVRARSTYVVSVDDRLAELGIVDADGRPRTPTPALHAREDRRGFARGAVLAAGSVSAPGRAPHLEVRTPTRELAEAVADAVDDVCGHRPAVSRHGDRFRAVLKSGAAIGDLLSALGATRGFLDLEEARLRRRVRAEANRLANADAANVRRSVEAAAEQVRAVERAIAVVGWDGLDDDLRQLALARLANTEATIGELADLLALSRSVVHRRLRRLGALADGG